MRRLKLRRHRGDGWRLRFGSVDTLDATLDAVHLHIYI